MAKKPVKVKKQLAHKRTLGSVFPLKGEERWRAGAFPPRG